MKSTLVNMVAVLFGITLVAAAGVGGVNMLTEKTIAEGKAAAIDEAILAVVPPFAEKRTDEMTIDNLPVKVYTATDADGAVVGYAVETMTKKGFSGTVKLMVGFNPAGEILNINVVEQSETPGLGTQMCDEGNPLIRSFQGRNPGEMKLAVKKDGGDVDALTAATISSRAYTDAVARAYEAYESVSAEMSAAEAEDCCECCCDTDNEGCEAQKGESNE